MIITKGTVYKLDENFNDNGIIYLLRHDTTEVIDPNFSEELIQAKPIFKFSSDWIRPHKGQTLVYISFIDERFNNEINLWLGTDDVFVFEDIDYSEITRIISDPIGNRIIFGKDKVTIDQVGTEFSGEEKEGAGVSNDPETENVEAKNPHINRIVMEIGKIIISQFKKDSEDDPENSIELNVDTETESDFTSTIDIKQKGGNRIRMTSEKDNESIVVSDAVNECDIITDKDGITIQDKEGDFVKLLNTGGIELSAKGGGDIEKMILGEKLKSFIANTVISKYNSHTHANSYVLPLIPIGASPVITVPPSQPMAQGDYLSKKNKNN